MVDPSNQKAKRPPLGGRAMTLNSYDFGKRPNSRDSIGSSTRFSSRTSSRLSSRPNSRASSRSSSRSSTSRKSRRASTQGALLGEEVITEGDGIPRLVGFHEYRRRIDNPSIKPLFEEQESKVQNEMLSAKLNLGASPIKVAKLKLLKRRNSIDLTSIEGFATKPENENKEEDSDDRDSLYGLPTPGRRGFEDEPLTPLGRSLNDRIEYFQDLGPSDSEPKLIMAARSGNIKTINKLLSKKSLNNKEEISENKSFMDRNDWDPLMWSSELGHRLISKKLTDFGFSTKHSDKGGWSALMWASHQNHIEIVEQLIKDGAPVNHSNVYESSALMWASHQGNFRVAELLLEGGANINDRCREGSTPLHYATKSGNLKIIKLLLDKGADINAEDIYSMTPLMHASEKGMIDVVKYLINWTPNPEINEKQLTSVDDETERSFKYTNRERTERTCRLDIENKYSQTARSLAKNWWTKGHVECVKLLEEREKEIEKEEKERQEEELAAWNRLSKRERRRLRRQMKTGSI